MLLACAHASASKAQGAYFWSQQQKVPEYYAFTEEPPYLIADMNHTVHAFNSQPLDLTDDSSIKAVFYRQWTLNNGWTYPNDILFDRDGQNLNMLGAASDQLGQVHLVIQKNSDIYYAKNYLVNAGNALSWPTPILVGSSSEPSRSGVENVAAIAVHPDGNELVIIYSGSQNGNGLYFSSSSDAGNSWTEPYPVYLTDDETTIVTDPKLYLGESGLVHAVWTTFLKSGAGGPGYYSNFDRSTQLWSEPMALDTPGIRTPSVIETQGNVFVSYHHFSTNGMWWRLSKDVGKTWSLPEQVSSRHVGTNGALSFSVDGANVLHAFFGERINDQSHGMWHAVFAEGTWTNLESVVRGPQKKSDSGGDGFDPRSARAVIVNGNEVLVTWGTDGAAGINGAWFSYKRLDAPELPTVILLPSESLSPSNSSSTIPAPTETVTAMPGDSIPDFELQAENPEFAQSPQTTILIGVVPALLFLVGTILTYLLFQSRKR